MARSSLLWPFLVVSAAAHRVDGASPDLGGASVLPTRSGHAGMLGTSSRELRRLYPDLCRTVGERWAQWMEQEATRRRDERLRVVEELVNQMVCEGVIPTIARLEERLVGIPKSFLLQERAACKWVCKAGKAELAM